MKINITHKIALISVASISLSLSANDVEHLNERIEYYEKRVASQKEKITEKNAALEQSREESETAKKIKDSIQDLTEKDRNLRASISQNEEDIKKNYQLIDFYKRHFRPKVEISPGEKMESLKLPTGRVLTSVTFQEISREGLKFSHSGGFAIVPYSGLPESLKDKVQIPPPYQEIPFKVDGLLNERPESLKSYAEIKSERKEAAEARYAADLAALGEREKKSQERIDARLKYSRMKAAKSSELSDILDAIDRAQNSKQDALAAINTKKVKPSASDVAKISSAFDARISRLRVAEREKKAEIAKLASERP